MTARLSPAFRWYLGLVCFSILGSLLSQLTGLDPGPVAPIAAVATLLLGFSVACRGLKLMVILAILAIGAASEVLGLYTGLVFGRYEYTDAWQPIFHLPGDKPFPLLLPFAWGMMAVSAYRLVSDVSSKWVRAASAAIVTAGTLPNPWMTSLAVAMGWFAFRSNIVASAYFAAGADLLMEYTMVHSLGYWRWFESGLLFVSPPHNTLGWIVVSLLAAMLIAQSPPSDLDQSREPGSVILVHLAFTLVITGVLAIPGPLGK